MKNDNGYQNDSGLLDVIIEIGISFIIMPLFLGIALTQMANTSTIGWDSYSLMMWGLLGMIFIASMIIAVMSHAKYQGKL
jgi:hypothetical protein